MQKDLQEDILIANWKKLTDGIIFSLHHQMLHNHWYQFTQLFSHISWKGSNSNYGN